MIREMKSEQKKLNEKLTQLEASSASGWTEAGKYKEDLESLRNDMKKPRKQKKQALRLRLELDQVRQIDKEQVEAIQIYSKKERECPCV